MSKAELERLVTLLLDQAADAEDKGARLHGTPDGIQASGEADGLRLAASLLQERAGLCPSLPQVRLTWRIET